MKYIQPLNEPVGSSYSNGDEVQGTQGSIIPAQALEHPQREIINVIQQAYKQQQGQVLSTIDSAMDEPEADDLTQLYQAIRKLCAPAGQMLAWGGTNDNIPKGFLVCDGQVVSRVDYADLFAILGEIHGRGDGTTTFNLPNLQDKFIIGCSSTREAASTGGSFVTDGHTLTINEMPRHRHEWGHDYRSGGHWGRRDYHAYNLNVPIYTQYEGGDHPHDHSYVPPYYALMYIIRT